MYSTNHQDPEETPCGKLLGELEVTVFFRRQIFTKPTSFSPTVMANLWLGIRIGVPLRITIPFIFSGIQSEAPNHPEAPNHQVSH